MDEPFRLRFRVRYGECDAQQIVFNARWGDYVDLAATEYTRALFGATDATAIGMDWRLVRQLTEWRAPARFDDVVEARVRTAGVGTTSFTLAFALHRWPDGALLASCETVYVCVAPGGARKQPVPAPQRARLTAGAPGVVIDHAGVGSG